MEHLMPKIREIADKITASEEQRKKLASFLLSADPGKMLSFPVKKVELNKIRIAAVDGGIVKRSLHGFDFVLARGVSVVFSYTWGRVEKVEYYPDKVSSPEPSVMEALSDMDYAHSSSIIRQRAEIRTAIETVRRFRPDIILLDGSIIPRYQDRPAKTSGVFSGYMELIALYKELFTTCKNNNTLLAGVVEDSRGTRFCDMVKENVLGKINDPAIDDMREILEKSRDTSLLFWFLSEGERTCVFPYSDRPEEHPVLADFGEFTGQLHSFYMKTAKYDRPIRIDFLGDRETAAKLDSAILSISGHHAGYGLPSVLIEADQVAKLAEQDMDSFYETVMSLTGNLPGVFRLRRDSRPF